MKSVCDSALDGDSVPETRDVPKAGEHRTISREQKKRSFHERITALRKMPGNCGGCGRPNSNGFRQCDLCHSKKAKYREAKRNAKVIVDTKTLAAFERRISSLEHELARMIVNKRAVYANGYRTGQRHERKVKFSELPYMSRQEAAIINHAYAGR